MDKVDRQAKVAEEQLDALVTVLDMVRGGSVHTRPELIHRTGLGRSVVAQRIAQLVESGLITEGKAAQSTGGRPARELRFHSDVGHVLVAELGATSIGVGIANLAGTLLVSREEPADVTDGPEVILALVEELFDGLINGRPAGAPPIWGIGVGVPGPVEFATGRPTVPPIMPGWDAYPIRERFTNRYGVPTWVDNEVNLMALGELRAGLARGQQDVVFIKIGSGIGAGLVSAGRLHRGAQGSAGDVGHIAIVDDPDVICRCGNIGCLEAVAGGLALGQQATAAARSGQSDFLAGKLTGERALTAADVAEAATHGDPYAVELLARTGRLVGRMLATVVNFYNPSLVIIGGGVAAAGDLLLASIRQTVYHRSLPLASRDLRIVLSSPGHQAGLHGAAFVVIDELFHRDRLATWINAGTPTSMVETSRAR